MFIRYTTANSFSFRNETTLSAQAVKTCKEHLLNTTFERWTGAPERLLKVMVIYGPNASGKSNLFGSLCNMLARISCNFRHDQTSPSYELPFLFDAKHECMKKPIKHELVFQLDDSEYTYGYETLDDNIVHEWLSKRIASARKRHILFERNDNGFICGEYFKDADELIQKKTRTDTLFLSVCARFAVPEAEKIVNFLQSSFQVFQPSMRLNQTMKMLEQHEHEKHIIDFMRQIDASIGDLGVNVSEEATDKYSQTGERITRKVFDIKVKPVLSDGTISNQALPFTMLASSGTLKMFGLAGPIFRALQNGGTIFIDELTALLHPTLTKAIVELFSSTSTNPANAQLIFNTHDVSLLGLRPVNPHNRNRESFFRRDQIYFMNKGPDMCSILYPLIKHKKGLSSIRKDASHEKEYLRGTYQAIPDISIDSFKVDINT